MPGAPPVAKARSMPCGFLRLVREKARLMQMDESFLQRGVNEGFSGGEKKRNEIFQMAVLEPTLAILDETDSGLDIDALKVVANGVNSLRHGRAGLYPDHALPAPAGLHPAGLRPRAGGRPDHPDRRPDAGARTGGGGYDQILAAARPRPNRGHVSHRSSRQPECGRQPGSCRGASQPPHAGLAGWTDGGLPRSRVSRSRACRTAVRRTGDTQAWRVHRSGGRTTWPRTAGRRAVPAVRRRDLPARRASGLWIDGRLLVTVDARPLDCSCARRRKPRRT